MDKINSAPAWETCGDGVALGPCAIVTDEDHQPAGVLQAQAMWTDDAGNVMVLAVPEDAVSIAAARNYAQAILMLCELRSPADLAAATSS